MVKIGSSSTEQSLIKLIRQGEIYEPNYLGKRDILVIGSKIARIEEHIEISLDMKELEVIDASNCLVFPGFIDGHVHIIGAGGRGGPGSRAREISPTMLIRSGLTTVIGFLGVDNTSRHIPTLVTKAKGLRAQFLNAYVLVGSYVFPPPTLTGSIEGDLALIEEVVGLKMAMGEPAGSYPSEEEITRSIAEVQRGGLISGKTGVVVIHVGDAGGEWFHKMHDILKTTSLPIAKVMFTHVNRNKEIFEKAEEYALSGGFIDLTASHFPPQRPKAVPVFEALSQLWEQGVPTSQITISSDSNATRLLDDGRIVLIPVGIVFEKTIETIQRGCDITEALRPVTINPAMRYGLQERKGSLVQGKDADFILLSRDLQLLDLYSNGRCLMRHGEVLIMDYL
jgi:beta-aspartyl-dipeptidase (metallo-type)